MSLIKKEMELYASNPSPLKNQTGSASRRAVHKFSIDFDCSNKILFLQSYYLFEYVSCRHELWLTT